MGNICNCCGYDEEDYKHGAWYGQDDEEVDQEVRERKDMARALLHFIA